MSMNYRLADMLAQIKNGQAARLARGARAASKLLGNVLAVLKAKALSPIMKKSEVSKGRYEFGSS